MAGLRFLTEPTLIHGDAHLGNLIQARDGTALADRDHVALGPREWDLAQVFHASNRLGYPAPQDTDGFVAAYGGDPRDWPGLATPVAIREVSGINTYIRNAPSQPFARRELAMRIDTLQSGDQASRWNRPTLERTQEA